jgi:hypothetical protein
VLALVATVFMKEVPLRAGRPEMGFQTAPTDQEEEERAVATR